MPFANQRAAFASANSMVYVVFLLIVAALQVRALRRREGLGLGDVKLGAMLGAMVGPQGVAFLLPAAAISGAAVGTALALRRGRGRWRREGSGPWRRLC